MPDDKEDKGRPVERSLKDINWPELIEGREFYPSPTAWEDEVLYFLLVDRFSDSKEYSGFADLNGASISGPTAERTTKLFDAEMNAYTADHPTWFDAGKKWCGGTIAGLKDKLGYLKRLGVTAIWLSPIFKQAAGSNDYHGYGIQNFLDVDPHFGTREELKDFVGAAHSVGMRVILDIVLNHAGDIFAYHGNWPYNYFQGHEWPVKGFRKSYTNAGSLPFGPIDLNAHPDAWPDGAVWPAEFQKSEVWTRQGAINDPNGWDSFPEYIDGDFYSLKNIEHGSALKDPAVAWDVEQRIHEFQPSQALVYLTEVYKFWIAYADIDGFRIDTVKHMEPGAVRFFANVIHEFAQSIGKENFYLIGEVTGGRANAVNIVNTTGLDAALGIDEIQDKLEFLAKGYRSPGDPQSIEQEGYFDLFRNSLLDNKSTHQWYAKHIVVMFDDHDQVDRKYKFRFCGDSEDSYRFLRAALGINLTTAGIPCIYYGTEQAFNGADNRKEGGADHSDVFLRECMFGGPFGSFQSTDRHFFNENHEIYRFIKEVSALREEHIALRRGRQYLRELSHTGNEGEFYYPQPVGGELRWVVAWSRIFAEREYLCAINTDADRPLTVWITVDHDIHPPGSQMMCLLSTDPEQKREEATVEPKNSSSIRIIIPPAGFVIYC
jgi:glycosidase